MSTDAHWLLPPDPTAPRDARRLVEEWAAHRGVGGGVSHDLLLVTSELVTNAVVHARGPVGLSVRSGQDTVTVRVTDAGSKDLAQASTHPGSTTWRGLTIVRNLSSAWGVRRRRRGKTVWATLPVD